MTAMEMETPNVVEGACHCGAVRFEVEIDMRSGLFVLCNCSLCTRKNRGVAVVALSAFQLIRGEADLCAYRWNTKREDHFFCTKCGIHTHHTLADPPARIGVNLACVRGLSNDEDFDWVHGDGAALPLVADG